MKTVEKSNAELLNDLSQLQKNYSSLKELYDKNINDVEFSNAELKKNQTLLNETFKIAKVGVWELNIDSGKLIWTDEMYNIHEVSNSFIPTHEKLINFYLPESRQIIEKAFQGAIEHGKSFDYELEIITAKKNRLWIHTIGKVNIIDNKITSIYGTSQDITERMLAEKALKRSYDLLSNLTAQVPGVVYQYRLFPDGHSCFPYSSPGMNDIYEYTPEDVREDATPVLSRIHPDDYDYIVNSIKESASTLNPYHSEFRVILPRQGLRWRLCDAHPERLKDGSVLWYGIISDITERKLAEEILKKTNEKVKLILDVAGEGIIGIDINGNITFVNPMASSLLGFEIDELSGRHSHSVFHHSYPDLSPFPKEKCPNYSTLSNGKHQKGEDYYWKKDGTGFYVEYSSAPIKENGIITGAVITFIDISERKKIEEEMKTKSYELERFNKLMVNREIKMIELKKEINELLIKSGKTEKYKTGD